MLRIYCLFGLTTGPIIKSIFDCEIKQLCLISKLYIALKSYAQTYLKITLYFEYLFEYVKQNLNTKLYILTCNI